MSVLAGHASGFWDSELGAGMPYNREKNESLVCFKSINKTMQNSLQNVYAIKWRVLYLSVASFCVLNIATVAASNSPLLLSEENILNILLFY